MTDLIYVISSAKQANIDTNLPLLIERINADPDISSVLSVTSFTGSNITLTFSANPSLKEKQTLDLLVYRIMEDILNPCKEDIHYPVITNVPPVETNDSLGNFTLNSLWIDTLTNTQYVCIDCTIGAAVWYFSANKTQGPEYYTAYDSKTSGTNGGSSTKGAWNTRTLNTLASHDGDNVSLATNQVTLQPGSWYLEGSSPGYKTADFQIRLFDVTNNVVLKTGTSRGQESTKGAKNSQATSKVSHAFTITTANVYCIEQRVSDSRKSYGLGIATGFGEEIYTTLAMTKFN